MAGCVEAATVGKRKRRKRCEYCGKLRNDVSKTVDPCDYDVNDETNIVVICDECYDERAADI